MHIYACNPSEWETSRFRDWLGSVDTKINPMQESWIILTLKEWSVDGGEDHWRRSIMPFNPNHAKKMHISKLFSQNYIVMHNNYFTILFLFQTISNFELFTNQTISITNYLEP
jgi:hypothetical protein